MIHALRRSALPLVLGLGLAAPAAALDLEAMSEAERDAFRAEVRAYLLENPEVLMEAIGVLEARQQDAQAAGDVELVARHGSALFDDGYSWVGGNLDGDVTVVEFMDYRCGYCRRAFEEVETLIASDGNIRFILKEFPILGEELTLASQFAIAMQQLHGDDAYKTAHDALMTLRSDVTPEALTRLAEALDFDPQPILDRMQGPEVAAVIAENRALAGAMAINGTPTFVMGDQLIRGYVPLDAMRTIVAQARQDG